MIRDTHIDTELNPAGDRLWTERKWLRLRAVQIMRENEGQTFAEIGRRLGVTGQRAAQLYKEITWPTDVVQRERDYWSQELSFAPRENDAERVYGVEYER